MSDLFDDLPDDDTPLLLEAESPETAHKPIERETLIPEVMQKPIRTRAEATLAELRHIEDELLKENMAIMRDAAKMRDIDGKSDEIPMEWIAEVGIFEAQKRLRIAKEAWKPSGNAATGLQLAKAVMVGIIKARATEKGRPMHLAIGTVAVNMPMPMFKVVEVDE
jgi:hypothetical protein